ncbi:class I SAM-dependent methyltransferase [Pseudonocardia humida]|uniref:class I SAM-dependent methyltransferase n=1 Tax=Pseudonocardia humida TaxID=2800819 RepID=UPI0035567C7F
MLELGVGTGTFAVALARAGHEVVGLDASPRMLDRMRTKPGGDRVTPVLGDMADLGAALAAVGDDGAFDVVVAFTNTFTNLTTLADQRCCLRDVAARLVPGGALVLEMAVPDARAYPGGQALRVAHVGVDHVVLQVAQYDPVQQVVDGATVVLGGIGQGVVVHPVRARNVSIVELDLMAELAGLTIDGRYTDWTAAPYRDGVDHISVFRRHA